MRCDHIFPAVYLNLAWHNVTSGAPLCRAGACGFIIINLGALYSTAALRRLRVFPPNTAIPHPPPIRAKLTLIPIAAST